MKINLYEQFLSLSFFFEIILHRNQQQSVHPTLDFSRPAKRFQLNKNARSRSTALTRIPEVDENTGSWRNAIKKLSRHRSAPVSIIGRQEIPLSRSANFKCY